VAPDAEEGRDEAWPAVEGEADVGTLVRDTVAVGVPVEFPATGDPDIEAAEASKHLVLLLSHEYPRGQHLVPQVTRPFAITVLWMGLVAKALTFRPCSLQSIDASVVQSPLLGQQTTDCLLLNSRQYAPLPVLQHKLSGRPPPHEVQFPSRPRLEHPSSRGTRPSEAAMS